MTSAPTASDDHHEERAADRAWLRALVVMILLASTLFTVSAQGPARCTQAVERALSRPGYSQAAVTPVTVHATFLAFRADFLSSDQERVACRVTAFSPPSVTLVSEPADD